MITVTTILSGLITLEAGACMLQAPVRASGALVPRALIIDDEPGIRFALRRWFERQAWTVDEAGDGDEALACLQSTSDDGDDRFDVIVCDVNLPKRSGESLYQQLELERPALTTRIIFSTGDDVMGARAGSLLQRHPWVLQKPFDMTTLGELVSVIARSA